MPRGPFGMRRLTSIGPFVEESEGDEWKLLGKTDDEKWDSLMEESDRRLEELGFDT